MLVVDITAGPPSEIAARTGATVVPVVTTCTVPLTFVFWGSGNTRLPAIDTPVSVSSLGSTKSARKIRRSGWPGAVSNTSMKQLGTGVQVRGTVIETT